MNWLLNQLRSRRGVTENVKEATYLRELFLYKATSAGWLVYSVVQIQAPSLWIPFHLHSPEERETSKYFGYL